MPFAVFANCSSSELGVGCCHSCSERYLFWQFRAPRAGWKSHPDDMVPKQCPFRRPIIWYLVYCATCLGSRDNSIYHTHPPTHIHDPSRIYRVFGENLTLFVFVISPSSCKISTLDNVCLLASLVVFQRWKHNWRYVGKKHRNVAKCKNAT